MTIEFSITEPAARIVARRGGTAALDFVPPIS